MSLLGIFELSSVLGAVVVVFAALLLRGRLFATFAGVLLAIHTSVVVALAPHMSWCFPVYAYLQGVTLLHLLLLTRARMRPLPYRVLVSLPASFFIAGTFLGAPWALAAAFGLDPVAPWLPFVIAAFGLVQSMTHKPEIIDIELDGRATDALARHPHGAARVESPLSIVQITDPHLGPFMSEAKLRSLCERAVARDPDLVLLTGDFLTMESSADHAPLARALAPLAALEGRVFACRGNHDLEAPREVARALAEVGATLLCDEAALVETRAGLVQIVGFDFVFRGRAAHIDEVCRRFPRQPGALRLALLHDPGAFRHVPPGEADLVLSGHTHGGQLGLLSVGLPHTIVSALSRIPDHGLWSQGTNRLYVHRGTGHYGFPLRLGVPTEDSLLRVHVTRAL